MAPEALIASVIALCIWGVGGVFDKMALNAMPGLSPLTAVLIRMIFGVVSVACLGTFTGMWDDLPRLQPITIGYLCVSAVLAAVIGQIAYYFAVSGDEASRVVVFTSAWPLVTVFMAAVLVNETLTPTKLLGTACVILGLSLLTLNGNRSRRARLVEAETAAAAATGAGRKVGRP